MLVVLPAQEHVEAKRRVSARWPLLESQACIPAADAFVLSIWEGILHQPPKTESRCWGCNRLGRAKKLHRCIINKRCDITLAAHRASVEEDIQLANKVNSRQVVLYHSNTPSFHASVAYYQRTNTYGITPPSTDD
jgi:hypothetical protein